MKRVAIVGGGVIGTTTALVLKRRFPHFQITLISDRPFKETCSFGPAGIFRIDYTEDKRNREWAKKTFEHFALLHKTVSPELSGVKLLSGYIQSDDKNLLDAHERMMSDIVFNFHWLSDRERQTLFVEPSKYAIHFTTFGTEGRRYVPYLREELSKFDGVTFLDRKLENLEQLTKSDNFDYVINSAGLNGGKLAGDDDTVYPIRGVAFEVDAPWHKHFIYRNVDTFTIPMNNSVILGTHKQAHSDDLHITSSDREDIWNRYLKLHPAFKGAKVISEWSGLRPARPTVRLEHAKIVKSTDGAECNIIHNYGHGSNGFTLSYGCALEVLDIIERKE